MRDQIEQIKLIVFDFDGVFTNNKVIVAEDGTESVICDRSDGLGISLIKSLPIKMVILSTEKNSVVAKRAIKLDIDCIHGIENKLLKLLEISSEFNISLENVAYVGNDINDVDCLKAVGLPIVVADAYPPLKDIAKIILTKNGGDGAIREFCEYFYNIKKNNI